MAADDNFAGVLGLADNLLASRTASVRTLARAVYAALFRLHDDAAQRERLLRDLVWRAAAWPAAPSGANVYHSPSNKPDLSSCCTKPREEYIHLTTMKVQRVQMCRRSVCALSERSCN